MKLRTKMSSVLCFAGPRLYDKGTETVKLYCTIHLRQRQAYSMYAAIKFILKPVIIKINYEQTAQVCHLLLENSSMHAEEPVRSCWETSWNVEQEVPPRCPHLLPFGTMTSFLSLQHPAEVTFIRRSLGMGQNQHCQASAV